MPCDCCVPFRAGGVTLDAEDRYALAAMDHPDIAVVAAPERPPLPGASSVAGVKRGREADGDELEAEQPPQVAGSTSEAPPMGVAAGGGVGDDADGDDMAAMLGFSGFGGSKKK